MTVLRDIAVVLDNSAASEIRLDIAVSLPSSMVPTSPDCPRWTC